MILSPRDETVEDGLTTAQGWPAYAQALRGTLRRSLDAGGIRELEISGLMVSTPPSGPDSTLRNGQQITAARAAELAIGMAGGDGPYCMLSHPGKLQIVSGWDGAIHLLLTAEAAARMLLPSTDDEALIIETRPGVLDVDEPAVDPVEEVADDAFWNSVAEAAADRLTLLCERWADGAHGSTWYRVTQDNVRLIASAVSPRSLICVAVAPDLRPDLDLTEHGFTAFAPSPQPGRLAHRFFACGSEDVEGTVASGFSLTLLESAFTSCAVVPDPDGVVRADWDRP